MNFARLFSGFGWLSSVYYLCFNASFRREQYSVLAARTEYARALTAASGSSALLRRNIHRLEKGLIMRPRRAVFAEDYIYETVTALQTNILTLEVAEREWALQVLAQYFDTVEDRGDITKARSMFALAFTQNPQPVENHIAVPYLYADLPKPSISYQDFFLLCQRRRSVRWFLADPVPQLLLEQAAQAAALAPSACNRQPFKFIQLIGDDAATAAGFAMGTTGFAAQIPTLLVVLGDLSAYPAERDRHVIYIDGALASMQLMLSLDTLGLASCPINWPDVEVLERKMDAFLHLKPWQRPVMLIAVGYPDPAGGVPFSAKKSVTQLLVPFRSTQIEDKDAD